MNASMFLCAAEYFFSSNSQLDYCMARLRTLAPMNAKSTVLSCLGHARKKMERLHQYTPSTTQYEDRHGYNVKEACHAVRFVSVASHLLHTGEFNFVSHAGATTVAALKQGWEPEGEARDTWEHAEQLLLTTAFKSGDEKKRDWTDQVNELDGRDSEEWNHELALFESNLREVVRTYLR